LIAGVLLLTACSGDDSGRSLATVTDSAGVRLIHNVGVPAGELVVTEDVRIGLVEGDEPYQFFQVYGLAVDEATEEVYVGNSQTGTVRVFSGDGLFLREFGGIGRGPGEVQSIRDVWFAGDDVVVSDAMREPSQTVLYTKAGEFIDSWRHLQPDRTRIVPSMWGPRGWLGHYYDGKPWPQVAPGEPSPQRRAIYLLFPDSGAAGDVLYHLPDTRLFGSTTTHGWDWPLFEPTPGFGMDGAGNFFLARGYPYRIEVYDPDGRLVRGISREYDPIPITDGDIDELRGLVSAVYDTMNNRSNPNEQRRRILERVDEQATFPRVSFRAPLRELLVARDGAFWVERADDASPAQLEYENYYGYINRATGRATRWDLFDADGRFLGSAALPPAFNPLHVTERSVTGVLKDEMDVEYVVRYRVASGDGD
jgi:hypothetical protein